MSLCKSSAGRLILSLSLFLVTTGTAFLLLFASAVAGLTIWMDSFVFATLTLGGLLAVVAAVIYFVFIRKPMAVLCGRVRGVFRVVRIAKNACEWIVDKLLWIWALGQSFRAGAQSESDSDSDSDSES